MRPPLCGGEVHEDVDDAIEATCDTSPTYRDLLAHSGHTDPGELEAVGEMMVLNIRNRDEITKDRILSRVLKPQSNDHFSGKLWILGRCGE